jgi:hypothetical protein
MVVVCKYDDCNHQQTLATNQIPDECSKCCGHWLEENEDYVLLQDNADLLMGCSLSCAKTQAQQTIEIDNNQRVFGRADFDFIGLRKSYISGTHFCLTINDGQLFIEDLGSTNGTFIGLVDKIPVSQKTVLKDSEWLVLGQEEFLIEYLYKQVLKSEEEKLAESLIVQKEPRCVECAEILKESIPCVCERCGTWNE